MCHESRKGRGERGVYIVDVVDSGAELFPPEILPTASVHTIT